MHCSLELFSFLLVNVVNIQRAVQMAPTQTLETRNETGRRTKHLHLLNERYGTTLFAGQDKTSVHQIVKIACGGEENGRGKDERDGNV